MNVLTIEPRLPFLETLARTLMRDPDELARTLVLLPSRRACIGLREAFMRLAEGRAMLLPRIAPVGEPDEDELLLDPELELQVPPSVEPLQRRLLLTRLVLAQGRNTYEQSIRLAGELERFWDEVGVEEVSLAGLDDLVPQEHAEHWQEILTFLTILRDAWPALLAERGRVDRVARRGALLDALADRWQRTPPHGTVIAAGMTGSIPVVARLLKVIARMPHGRVVLPALDLDLEEASWRSLPPSHPQAGLKDLLDRMSVDRAAVSRLHADEREDRGPDRSVLWREVLRSAEGVERWRETPPSRMSLSKLTRVEAAEPSGEAMEIALRLRHALVQPERRAALVTPNRTLGRRVASELARWGIEIDDSAGTPLDQSPPGSFLLLCAHMLAEQAGPVPLLSALKHPLASGCIGTSAFRRRVRTLERACLRGLRLPGGFEMIRAALRERVAVERPDAVLKGSVNDLDGWLDELATRSAPFASLLAQSATSFKALLEAHIAFAEWLAGDESGECHELWAMEAGHEAHRFVTDLIAALEEDQEIPGSAYPAALAVLMGTRTVRPGGRKHPRVSILGQFESRLLHADLVILGGLNEGVWPRELHAGPWLNRTMRRSLGLPPIEQQVGAAAHDFMSAACAPEVVLTRASKDEQATPTTPSRWIARLQAVLQAAGMADVIDADPTWRHWADALDRPGGLPTPARRPAPRPPVAIRPRQLTVSEIERLMRNPYAVYARRILELQPLEDLDADPSGADRGMIIHAALDRYVRLCAAQTPEQPLDTLLRCGRELFERIAHRPQVMAVWWPRFVEIARWVVAQENERVRQVERIASELRGSLTIEAPFDRVTIRARADRVEVGADGAITIVDYKTGSVPQAREVQSGLSPQLPLEALIASAGGFEGLDGERAVSAILFWQLRGAHTLAGVELDRTDKQRQVADLLEETRAGLQRLLAHFDDPKTPYIAVPRPEIAPSFDEYAHLARKAEWSGSEAVT